MIEGFLWGGLLQQTTEVENYPGFRDGIMGPELMQTMRDQAERFGARFLTDNATRFEPAAEEGGLHTVWVHDEEFKARTVILAMGAEHRKLGVPGEEELANGRGVSYCATCDAAFFKDKETIIVGGGDSAMEEAIFLAKFSSKVDDRAPARRVPRVADHARPRQGDREHRAADARTSSRSSCPARAARSARRGCATSRPARSASSRWRARSSRSATCRSPRSCAGMVETDENGYVAVEGRSTRTGIPGRVRRRRPRRPHVPPGGHGRRLRAVRRRSTPSGTCATTRTSRRRPALEGTGDLAEEQWFHHEPAARPSARALSRRAACSSR